VLGAKKTQKLGAKKVTGEEIDFEAAEKAAKAEAERIERLGYDPEAEKAEEQAKAKSASFVSTAQDVPAPIVTPKAGSYGSGPNPSHTRSPSEVERLGMGMGRLGFGQVGSNRPGAPAAAPPKKLGFGSVGASKAPADGNVYRPRFEDIC
jgi:ADP-ribosylation factor GTPase-activating protein 2/3